MRIDTSRLPLSQWCNWYARIETTKTALCAQDPNDADIHEEFTTANFWRLPPRLVDA